MQGGGGDGDRPIGADVSKMSEDEKMDKFYELIRSYRAAREKLRIVREIEDEEWRRSQLKRIRTSISNASPSWIPKFKWEDFAGSSQTKSQKKAPVPLPPSFARRSDDPAPEVDAGGLDLTLRL